jgi:hypothetical protein
VGRLKAYTREYGGVGFTKKSENSVKHYLAVDPGQEGGMCIVSRDGTPMEFIRMPAGTARILDWIVALTGKYSILVMVAEKAQAMPKQGIVGAFRYGAHYGIFETAATMLQIPYHEVRPAIWKKALGLTHRKQDSITACRKFFPKVELIPDGCRTPHDGIAEALLIAQWARQKDL